jgi:ABC-2 type transport system ATP-binding protein
MTGVPRQQVPTVIQHLLEQVQMKPQANQLVSSLSGGQKQRVSLAIALIGNPTLLVLDEPTVGLDPVLREQIWTLLRELAAAGTTIIISSHVMDEAERCDELLLIREGEIIAHDTPVGLRQQTGASSVEQSFLRLVESTE